MRLFARRAAWVCTLVFAAFAGRAAAQVAGTPGGDDLVIAEAGKPAAATVVVAPGAGEWERRAATDLVRYVGLITGTEPKLADTAEAGAGALKGTAPVIVVGQAAISAEPSLKAALERVAK